MLHVSSSSTRQVVLFAASNDHTSTARLERANYLAMADIGSVLLEQAFYGERRAHAGRQPVRTVVEFLEMTIAAPTEGLGLIRWIAAPEQHLASSDSPWEEVTRQWWAR